MPVEVPAPDGEVGEAAGGEAAAQVFLAGQACGARGVQGEGAVVGDGVFGGP